MITREADYAIRTMLYLARPEHDVVSTAVLAEEMDIPYRFLRRLLLRCVESGLVESVRGKRGGIRLAGDPAQVSLLDIIRTVDPAMVALNSCLLEDGSCSRSTICVVHTELAELQCELNARLAQVTLASLVERERREQMNV